MSWIFGTGRTERVQSLIVDVVVVHVLAANGRVLYLYAMAERFAKCSDGDQRRRYNMYSKSRAGRIFES